MSWVAGSFTDKPLHSREDFMRCFMTVAKELGMPDERGACVCAGMCVLQEAGFAKKHTSLRQVWTPGNDADPCFAANPGDFPHDSMGDDGLSVGPFQQQVGIPPASWGWGGKYGDPEGTRKRMDMYESTKMFMESLKRNGYDASNAQSANDSVQRVQRSGVPQAYKQWFTEANHWYDGVGEPEEDGGAVAGWTGDPVWLEDVLRPVLGDRLKVLPGWQESGHGDFGDIRGVMVHSTGNSKETAESIQRGRPDLEGPLSNLHIAPDGIVTIVAVGVCWHAGEGEYPWLPRNNANQHMIGIECAYPTIRADGGYDPHERWPDKQVISMRDTCAALALKLEHPANRVIGHKEWAGASQGKIDPINMSMTWFRGEVAKAMRGEFDKTAPKPPPIPPKPELIDYHRQSWEQIRGRWEMLGDQTIVEALAEVRDKVLGTSDKAKKGARFN